MEIYKMCDHAKVKCIHCGAEGSPAQLLARLPRGMTPAKAAALKKARAAKKANREGK